MAKKNANKTPKQMMASAHHPLSATHPTSGKNIHELLSALREQWEALYWGTADQQQRSLLSDQMEKVNKLNFLIFEKKIKTNTVDWEDAADALAASTKAAQAALQDIHKTVETLQMVGKAIALVAKLAVLAA
jgi:hypothetical protein